MIVSAPPAHKSFPLPLHRVLAHRCIGLTSVQYSGVSARACGEKYIRSALVNYSGFGAFSGENRR